MLFENTEAFLLSTISMANINKKLNIWEEEGLISEEQTQAILAFENQDNKGQSNWWLYSLLILGVAIIGLGIISIIAANWALISDEVKLGSAFLLLGVMAAAIVWLQSRPVTPWFDTLIAAFMLMCLATIGLIAQIYHVQGKWYQALLLWGVISFPLATFARHLLIPFFWVSLFLHGLVWSSIDLTTVRHSRDLYQELPAILLLAPLLAAVFYLLGQRLSMLAKFRSSFYFWFQISLLVALVAIDLIRSGGESQNFVTAWYIPAWIAATALAALILSNPAYRILNKALLLAALSLLLLYYIPDWFFTGTTRYTFSAIEANQQASLFFADDLRAPVLTIMILFLYAIHTANSGRHRTFNLITFLIGLRFVVLYFQAMGGLAATGLGLIISGLLIIGIAWFWYRSRDYLQRWSKELSK